MLSPRSSTIFLFLVPVFAMHRKKSCQEAWEGVIMGCIYGSITNNFWHGGRIQFMFFVMIVDREVGRFVPAFIMFYGCGETFRTQDSYY